MGLSRIAEGLVRHNAPHIHAMSAGIDVDDDDRGIDEDARMALSEVGARCDGDPSQLTPSLADKADLVVVLGDIDVSEFVPPEVEVIRWEYEDPKDNGIDGIQRYRILRDDLLGKIRRLEKSLS